MTRFVTEQVLRTFSRSSGSPGECLIGGQCRRKRRFLIKIIVGKPACEIRNPRKVSTDIDASFKCLSGFYKC